MSNVVTITTGGVPAGILSLAPKMCDTMKMIAQKATARIAIAWTRLLRNVGRRDVRGMYGEGFEDFLVGKAMCILSTKDSRRLGPSEITISRPRRRMRLYSRGEEEIDVLAANGGSGYEICPQLSRPGLKSKGQIHDQT